jgi:hypothetical protein
MIERAFSSHLLKLVTGVDISTRAVNSSGRPGNEVKRRSRTAAAAPNSVAFLLSMLILKLETDLFRIAAVQKWKLGTDLESVFMFCPC